MQSIKRPTGPQLPPTGPQPRPTQPRPQQEPPPSVFKDIRGTNSGPKFNTNG